MPATGSALHSVPVRARGPSSRRRAPGPIRTCVGCRTREQADVLLRVIVENGRLVPDPRRRRPGRGAWLHPVTECLDRAERRSAFARALRVRGAPDVTEVREWLRQCTREQCTREHRSGRDSAERRGSGTDPEPTSRESKVDPS